VNNQKDALVERKEVAQKTKDFRKLDDTAKLTEIKPLLKSESQVPKSSED
jgi:homeobox protein cut-like